MVMVFSNVLRHEPGVGAPIAAAGRVGPPALPHHIGAWLRATTGTQGVIAKFALEGKSGMVYLY
jgi:hypothetical protein